MPPSCVNRRRTMSLVRVKSKGVRSTTGRAELVVGRGETGVVCSRAVANSQRGDEGAQWTGCGKCEKHNDGERSGHGDPSATTCTAAARRTKTTEFRFPWLAKALRL